MLPVVGDDGTTRMVRSCLEGPVFHGDRVSFDDIGTIPPDAVGAPQPAVVKPVPVSAQHATAQHATSPAAPAPATPDAVDSEDQELAR